VHLTVEIDTSRLVSASAYVPLLDLPLEGRFDLKEEVPDQHDLNRDVRVELDRLEAARSLAADRGGTVADDVLDRIDAEGTAGELRVLADAARADPDAAVTAGERLQALRAALDRAEDALEWPGLVREAMELAAAVQLLVATKGESADRDSLRVCEGSLRAAISSGDAGLLRQRMNELRVLATVVLDRTGELEEMKFRAIEQAAGDMSDRVQASSLISKGNDALRRGDRNALRNINRQLVDLLPGPPPEPDPFSTVGPG
jgi:molecular chaperone DnaK